jgi:DNA-binding MarR family transcriptional regulator
VTDESTLTGAEWGTWRSFRSMRRQLDRALEAQLQRDSAISIPEFEILFTLNDVTSRQLRIKDIAAHTGWEKSRVSHQVSRLERRGLLVRRECETDGRGSWLSLTPAGQRAVTDATLAHSEAIRTYFFAVLHGDDEARLLAFSRRVLEAIDGALPDSDVAVTT